MNPSRNIIITGVSSGIGKQLVRLFLDKYHFNVTGISRNKTMLEMMMREEESYVASGRLKLIAHDISIPEGISSITESIYKHWTHVDVLINNAGKLINKPFDELSAEDWNTVYATNVFGPAQLVRLLLPLLTKKSDSPPSHVLNIASMGGIQGSMKFAGLSAYSSSKAALIGLTECLAEELKSSGIRCNALALGSVDTEMFNAAFPGFNASKSVAEMADFIADFAVKGAALFNGKVLQVSDSTP
jgi:3-oxoacyl-[acyl-carrier protein] reductase